MKLIVSCLILLVAGANIQAQGWRGIVPLHSSCDDVKQKLGISECRNRTYDLTDSRVSILFSDGTCSSGWNVPAGTVITLDVHSKAQQQFSELALDTSSYKKVTGGHLPGLTRYESKDRSMSITVSAEGLVMLYFYGPSINDDSLRCIPEKPDGPGSVKFDEYGDVSLTEERTRLDRFAYQLRVSGKSWLGYIFVYGGSGASAKQAHERGVRARKYLVRQGVEASSLVLIDGGLREALTVELFVTIKGTIPPTPRPTIRQD